MIALVSFALASLLALAPTLGTSTRLLATYLLKPTQVLIRYPDAFIAQIASPFLQASVGASPDPVSVVDYPASLYPLSPGYLADPSFNQSVAAGLAAVSQDTAGDDAPVIFGYSQGVTVATEYKRRFNSTHAGSGVTGDIPAARFAFIGNPNRPNGGLLSRFPGLYIPFFDITANGATPTETAGAAGGVVTTDDYARQYDFFADYPTNLLNLVSLANAVAGLLTHADYLSVGPQDATIQDQYGDTRFYLIPTKRMPLLAPLSFIVPSPVLSAIDAPLRVIVEAGYDRTVSPGAPAPTNVTYWPNAATVAENFLRAIPTGWDDALAELGRGRPFGTTPAGPYGVGGPPVTLPDEQSLDDQNETLVRNGSLVPTVEVDAPDVYAGSSREEEEPRGQVEVRSGQVEHGEYVVANSPSGAGPSSVPAQSADRAATVSSPDEPLASGRGAQKDGPSTASDREGLLDHDRAVRSETSSSIAGARAKPTPHRAGLQATSTKNDTPSRRKPLQDALMSSGASANHVESTVTEDSHDDARNHDADEGAA